MNQEHERLTRILDDHRKMTDAMPALSSVLAQAVDWIVEAIGHGNKVVAMGNGGSAADAQHLVAELVGRFMLERRGLPAIALPTNAATMTSVANDYGYAAVFARQVEAVVCPGDVVIAFSTSGKSQNVLAAISAAKLKNARTIGMTGADGGKMKDDVDLCLCVPATQTPRIQEGHVILLHALCEAVEVRASS